MTKIIATLALLFVVFTNLNATEVPTQMKDSNCTAVKCKTEKSNDSNCTKEKCKTEKKNKCTTKEKKNCSRDGNQTSNKEMPKWNASMDSNSSIKSSRCCKGKKKEETKEENPTMKCAAGKCGGGKCGGK
jgi:hypothetical protein